VRLALGMTNAHGNYSANEHGLGPRILNENRKPIERVFNLGLELFSCQSVDEVPKFIYSADISSLKIGVGTEMALMLRPNKFWVCNVRSVWAYLLIKHDWDRDKADEERSLYRSGDPSSEMSYDIWKEIYRIMGPCLDKLIIKGNRYANEEGIKPGKLKYLWADAIANALYEYNEDE
jgi:hypothetical protein